MLGENIMIQSKADLREYLIARSPEMTSTVLPGNPDTASDS